MRDTSLFVFELHEPGDLTAPTHGAEVLFLTHRSLILDVSASWPRSLTPSALAFAGPGIFVSITVSVPVPTMVV